MYLLYVSKGVVNCETMHFEVCWPSNDQNARRSSGRRRSVEPASGAVEEGDSSSTEASVGPAGPSGMLRGQGTVMVDATVDRRTADDPVSACTAVPRVQIKRAADHLLNEAGQCAATRKHRRHVTIRATCCAQASGRATYVDGADSRQEGLRLAVHPVRCLPEDGDGGCAPRSGRVDMGRRGKRTQDPSNEEEHADDEPDGRKGWAMSAEA
jgi:hypothetical protein